MVNNLLIAYQLNNSLQVIRSTPASYAELKEFHLESYLDHLKHFQELEDDYMTNEQDEEYGIGVLNIKLIIHKYNNAKQ